MQTASEELARLRERERVLAALFEGYVRAPDYPPSNIRLEPEIVDGVIKSIKVIAPERPSIGSPMELAAVRARIAELESDTSGSAAG